MSIKLTGGIAKTNSLERKISPFDVIIESTIEFFVIILFINVFNKNVTPLFSKLSLHFLKSKRSFGFLGWYNLWRNGPA